MTEHLQLTLQEADEALGYIKPNLPYLEWSRIGRSLYSEFGDDAREIFESWSSTGGSYNKSQFNSWWKNFRKTKRTTFGSFIHFAMEAGWNPKREDFSDEEKRERAAQFKQRQYEAKKKRESAEKKQWRELKKEEKQFKAWSPEFSPTQYMLEKQMADIQRFVDVRLGVDKYNNPCLTWPIYEKLFNQGRFCGFERILDKGFKPRVWDKELSEYVYSDRVVNKLSSDNARTDIGFCTFGQFDECDRSPKRIFVVGGFADAYSAHLSSGEVIITPIGEGNIPALIERLKGEHPEIQFIAAPDNDKAGHEMVRRAGGFYSLPSTDSYDWSDTYVNQGMSAVCEQLLNVQGFEQVLSDTRYLSVEIRKGLNLLESDMGTGKSTAVQNFIKANPHLKTLVISHRVALAQSLKYGLSSDDISVDFYQDLIIKDPTKDVDANIALRNAHVLVCSVDSLHRLTGSQWDAVFVDEFEQNLGQYFAKTIQFGEHCLNYLQFVLTNSQYQILADAHLGDLCFDFCHYIGLTSGTHFKNEFKVAEGKKLFVYESKDHLLEEVMQQVLAKDKRYIYANSKEQVKAIGTAIEQERERKHYNGSVLVVHADVTKDEDVKTALKDINAVVPNLDVLIASPTLGTGFDIKSNAHQFDKTIGFLSSRVGTAEEGHQGLNRARDVQEFHVYIDPAERSEPTDSNYIQNKLIEEVSSETMKLLALDPTTGEFTTKNTVYEWLYCQVKAKNNHSYNRYKARFIELAKKGGYEIINVAKNSLSAKFGKEVRTEAKDRNNRMTLKNIMQAPVHVGDMLQTVMRNGEDYTAVEIAKSKVNYDLHLDAANDEDLECLSLLSNEVYAEFSEAGVNARITDDDAPVLAPSDTREAVITALTYKQSKNRFVDAIKKLSWVNVAEHSAKVFDLKDVQYAESRVSWRHIQTKRKHMLKLLQTAGIDEALNYNGHKWNAEKLSLALGQWLRRKETRDRLFKYSNITVTQNTLQNPVQWLNNHLRSFGVPIVANKLRLPNGSVINEYSVDVDAWESVKTLVRLRTEGIEESLQEDTAMTSETIQKLVSQFISEISAPGAKVKQGWPVQYDKLEQRCRLAGLVDEADQLEQAFAHIAHNFDDQRFLKNDPPSPIVINKSIGQGGSLNNANHTSENGATRVFEGGGDVPSFAFPEKAAHGLSKEQLNVAMNVAKTAVEQFKLPILSVIGVMIENGLDNFVSESLVDAWAGTIRDMLAEGA
jgi:hypothetical protein